MRKSLFRKYLGLTSLIIGICFLFFMIVMITLVSKQWNDEKRDALSKSAVTISTAAASNTTYDEEKDVYVIGNPVMRSLINIYATTNDCDIFLTDLSGARLFGNYFKSGTDPKDPVPADLVAAASIGTLATQTTLGGAYDRSYYLVATPIVTEEGGEPKTLGIVFCATSSAPLMQYWFRALKMFIGAGASTFLIAFCLIWFFSYRMVMPLRQMSAAAHSFGAGDFSRRIPVESNDEIGELAEALNNMATSLSDSEGTRRNFVANVSHELKTPMTTIAGFIDGILDGTIPQSEQTKYLRVVSEEVKRLSRLVRSMLDLSRIDAGELKLNPKEFDLSETILSTVLTFEKSIEEKGLDIRGLDTLAPTKTYGDADLCHQVIYNLVENAVKFTNEGGYIEFSVEDLPDETRATIRNSGLGIEPEEIGMIFERFYKTDKSRSKDKNGMGLGLYIVKTIVRLHGGEIRARSEKGEYTEFSFNLPKKPDRELVKEQTSLNIQDAEYKE